MSKPSSSKKPAAGKGRSKKAAGKKTASSKRPAKATSVPDKDSNQVDNDDFLTHARAAWEQGDWVALAHIGAKQKALESHPAREKLSLLVSVGLAQAGDLASSRRFVEQARNWGCPERMMAQFMVGGALNTLGRAACLLGEDSRAQGYFEGAILCADPLADAVAFARSREINEKLALGLLPEAVDGLGKSLTRTVKDQTISTPQAEIFKIQLELLNSALALAQQRGQVTPDLDMTGAPTETDKSRATSQLGQDLWVLKQTGHKREGFFVEFGATDGVLLSNTYLLETEYGWNGICAEPNPQFFTKLRRNRQCAVSSDCIMGQSGQMVEFIMADEYGGAAEYAGDDSHAAKRAAFRDSGAVITLKSISLDEFLKKHDAPRRIDYLSIDTEGSEYEILSAFPFAEWDIRMLTVEHNYAPIREDIRILLEGHGYVRTKMQWDDWFAKA